MELGSFILLWLTLLMIQSMYQRHMRRSAARDYASVVYLSKHDAVHDQITQAFNTHRKSSTDVINAHRGNKGALTDIERIQFENLRVYLLVQWQLLLGEIQNASNKDHAVLTNLRQRDQDVIEGNHLRWSEFISDLNHMREKLQNINLLSDDVSRSQPH